MKSILTIGCIVFFCIITYGLAQSSTMNKYHTYNCRTIYIPEDMDLEKAFYSIKNLTSNGLKKRAIELGATDEIIKESDDRSLKVFIIQNSISDEHILFEDLNKTLDTDELIKKRDYCRNLSRNNKTDVNCPTKPNPELNDYNKVKLPEPTNIYEEEHKILQDPFISIREMREDIDDYINKNII